MGSTRRGYSQSVDCVEHGKLEKMEIGGNMGKKILLLLIGIAVTTILALMWFMN